MSIITDTTTSGKITKSEQWEQNLTNWEEVAPSVTVASVKVTLTDDETGDTYEVELPPGRVVNVKALSGAGAKKSAGFNMNAPLEGDVKGRKLRMNLQSNVFISKSKEALAARAEREAQKRHAEQQRD